jgi:hypothetical protein
MHDKAVYRKMIKAYPQINVCAIDSDVPRHTRFFKKTQTGMTYLCEER